MNKMDIFLKQLNFVLLTKHFLIIFIYKSIQQRNENIYSLPTKTKFNPIKKIKTSFLAVVIAPVTTIFDLISYSFGTEIRLILILIDVQYSQNAGFSFEKFSNRQNHSSSGSHHLVKKYPQQSSLPFGTKSGKLLKFQVKKNSNFILKPR